MERFTGGFIFDGDGKGERIVHRSDFGEVLFDGDISLIHELFSVEI